MDPAASPRPSKDDFTVVYTALAQHVKAEAEKRGRRDISLLHPTLAASPPTAISRAALMSLPDRDFVENCILLIADRPGGPREISAYVNGLLAGSLEREALLDVLMNEVETSDSGRAVRLV